MSRIAKNPVHVPTGLDVELGAGKLVIKNKSDKLSVAVPSSISVQFADGQLAFSAVANTKEADAMSGTIRAIAANMVKGLAEGFERSKEKIAKELHSWISILEELVVHIRHVHA